MKKIYFILCLAISVFANAQVINFPDANFKAKLLQPNVAQDYMNNILTIDANNDGEIEVSEVQDVYLLDVSNSNISDLTGISNFINLKFLTCRNNLLTNITIDHSISLEALRASHNLLTSVDVDYSIMQEGLDLSYNNLTSFTVANAYFAEPFDLSNNQLTSLTLDNCVFSYFSINHNDLSSIQFIGNIEFAWPYASFMGNKFSLLEFPANVNFDSACTIYLGNNTVDNVYFNGYQPGNIGYSSLNNTSFDLGNFYMSKSCDPEDQGNVTIMNSPNLQNVIFKNGFNHTTITCDEGGTVFQNPALNLIIGSCPNLSHICVDAPEQPYFQARINNLGMQSQVTVDTNCDSLVLGSEEFSDEQQFTIFPVPAKNILQIHSSDNLEIRNIEIYNNLGQIVQKEFGNKQIIDVSQLAKGSYYLKIYTTDLTSVKQFLKE